MSLAKACPACGTLLPDDALEGAVCAACAASDPELAAQTAPADLRPPVPIPTPAPTRHRGPQAVGEFEILGKLGQGGMGAVYRARQTTLDRLVALKILPEQFEDDDDYVARFQREARVAASLDHPNLVRVYSSGLADGCHFIAMELVEGENLHKRLKRAGPLAPAEALRIALGVTRGLQCGWERAQLIHRDIKPSNIYLGTDGSVKLGDLGLAKSLLGQSTGLTLTGAAMGTPHYISPEQAKGERNLDFRADLYSLGCTLYQCLTGTTPYDATDALSVMNMHVTAPPPDILEVMPHCPAPVARLVGRLLKKQRHERPASYEALITELERALAFVEGRGPDLSEEFSDAPVGTPHRDVHEGEGAIDDGGRRGAPSRPLLFAIAAAVLVLGALAYILIPSGEKAETGGSGEQRSGAPATSAGASEGDQGPADVRSANAGGASANATVAPVAPAATFENTLGMRFVPVPITGGPTDGQRVLFSVWETRVQDYEVFARETNRAWPNPDLQQERTHPAVMVTWDDATAFCAWLTERERKAGKLAASELYRLPSDHEWSCAVGLGDKEDAAKTPEEKKEKIGGVFPWGGPWPPPPGAANFAGEELKPLLAAGQFSYISDVIKGWRDDFPGTAPVEALGPNALGLTGLAGNAWEWCEDWFNQEQKSRTLRSGSWNNWNHGSFLSSVRHLDTPSTQHSNNGFRVVLAPTVPEVSSPPTPPVSPSVPSTPATATQAASFENSLGMRFVPVPITGGPTDGKRVLFSVWETRVQDYEVFVKETRRKWPKPVFAQEPTHPAVMTTWDDATAFGTWLTARERKAGKIGADERYRLPSDHEWSCAAGIGDKEDANQPPAEKSGKLAAEFPWGTQWPPPPNAGNYSGTETEGKKTWKQQAALEGFRDAFPHTAPVGRFVANPLGLLDLGGNAWEWCEDLWDRSATTRVIRGAAFDLGRGSGMLSSFRSNVAPASVPDSAGFRLVLAPAP